LHRWLRFLYRNAPVLFSPSGANTRLDSETLPTFGTPSINDGAATLGAHPLKKAVRA
jgi:hypothetical protein